MKKFYFLVFFTTFLFASETNLLTQTKQDIIELTKKQIEQKEHVNKYNWLSNITLNSSISEDDDNIQSEDYSVSIAQDIFRFGGITSQIEYSKELKKLETLNLEITTKEDMNALYTLLVDIKLNEISLKQNVFSIKNNAIDIIQKKSEYQSGQLGISDLNDVLMTKNGLRETQKTLGLSKQKNINSLKEYTTQEYYSIAIPKINLMSKELFLQHSTAVQYASLESNVNNWSYKIKKSSYLPTLTVDSKYGYSKSDTIQGDDYYKYGVSLSVPISFTSHNDIEQSKLEYLISKKESTQKQTTIALTYDEAIITINNYKEKIDLALEDIVLYEELLSVNEEEYQAGYKTLDDVETLKNTKQIRLLDITSYELYIQKQLITLYSMLR